jgi:hypothetical protein
MNKANTILINQLIKLKVDSNGWRTLYRDLETGRLWEKSYPNSDMHGGGSPQFTELEINSPDEWI